MVIPAIVGIQLHTEVSIRSKFPIFLCRVIGTRLKYMQRKNLLIFGSILLIGWFLVAYRAVRVHHPRICTVKGMMGNPRPMRLLRLLLEIFSTNTS